MKSHSLGHIARLLLGCGLSLPVGIALADGDFKVLHSFCKKAGCPDGGPSGAGVLLNDNRDLLGAGEGGHGYGALFRLSANAHGLDTVYSRLHAFCGGTCRDGQHPDFPLIQDGNGNLYGTTAQGGADGGGTIFEASPSSGGVSVLNAFCSGDCKMGFSPSSGVTYQGAAFGYPYDGSAPLYGTTGAGGSLGGGTIYVLARQDGKARVKALYSFCSTLPCKDGAVPMGGLTVDSAGNILGITNFGGAHDEGAVFELSPAGTNYSYSVIYSFCSQNSCTDGIRPAGGLALDGAGNLYGTTTRSGDHDEGTLFKLSPNGSGYSFQVLYQFCSEASCTDGGDPEAPLRFDGADNLLGTAVQGGAAGAGVIFEFTPQDGTERVLHSFCALQGCTDGSVPTSPLTIDTAGDLFGTTVAGGSTGSGVAFELRPTRK